MYVGELLQQITECRFRVLQLFTTICLIDTSNVYSLNEARTF